MCTVAAIIPTMFNRNNYTIESVMSCLKQTVPFHEIIIVGEKGPLNDCIDRLNWAVQNMQSTHFVLLCDDDLLAPTFLEETVKYADSDIVYTGMELFGHVNRVEPARYWSDAIMRDTVPFISSLVQKTTHEKVGGFDHVVFFDWDFWFKCWEAGASAVRIDKPLFLHRQHAGQSSHNVEWAKSRHEVLAKHGLV